MITVRKEMMIEMAHRLPSHKGLCRFIHGHSYKFVIHAEAASVNANGMIVDFKELKNVMEKTIGAWDHSLILACDDPAYNDLVSKGYCQVWAFPSEPTAENMAKWIGTEINDICKTCDLQFSVFRVDVWETTTSCASWYKEVGK